MLIPWQEEALNNIYGNVDENGDPITEMAYLEVAKKSGKTELCSGLALLTLVTAKNPGCQVYGAASATRQAMNVYRAAAKMVEQSPLLQSRLRVLRGTNRIVKRSDPDSFYAAIAADGDVGDGVNPACVIADEVHRWKTRKQLENWDVLSNGGITRKKSLTVAITTAGVQNESPLAWRLHEKARKIQQGVISDSSFYGRIYAAAQDDDPGDPKTWIKANPSLIENGGFLHIDKIRQKYESHLAEGDLTSFKRYFLNIWDQKENRAINMVDWDASAGSWLAEGLCEKLPEDKVRAIPKTILARFINRACYVGVDLSMTTDLSAVCFVFPNEDDDDGCDVLPFFWTPQARVQQKQVKDGMPYKRWADEGFIELCPGNVIDTSLIRERLEWGYRMFNVQEIAFDPWNSRELSTKMIDAGFPCVEVTQGYSSLNEPSKKILKMVANGKLSHGANPILRWNASCVAVKELNDNLMFDKPERQKNSSRIDGMSAMADGVARWILGKGQVMKFSTLWSAK